MSIPKSAGVIFRGKTATVTFFKSTRVSNSYNTAYFIFQTLRHIPNSPWTKRCVPTCGGRVAGALVGICVTGGDITAAKAVVTTTCDAGLRMSSRFQRPIYYSKRKTVLSGFRNACGAVPSEFGSNATSIMAQVFASSVAQQYIQNLSHIMINQDDTLSTTHC